MIETTVRGVLSVAVAAFAVTAFMVGDLLSAIVLGALAWLSWPSNREEITS